MRIDRGGNDEAKEASSFFGPSIDDLLQGWAIKDVGNLKCHRALRNVSTPLLTGPTQGLDYDLIASCTTGGGAFVPRLTMLTEPPAARTEVVVVSFV